MSSKVTKISTEKFKELVHEIEDQAKKETKEELVNLKYRFIELRKNYTDLENKNIKLQQQNEILKYKLKELDNKPLDKFDKLANDLFNS